MASATLLDTVAQHEETLQQDLLAAQEEARRIVDAARQEAATHLQQEQNRIDSQVMEARRSAAEHREQLESQIARRADEEVAQIRAKTAAGRDAARDEVVRMILPADTEGLAS